MNNRRPLPNTAAGFVVGLVTVVVLLTGAVQMVSAAPFAYMANQGSDSVSVVDAADPTQPTVVATIPVGSMPADVAVNAAGTRAYVPNVGAHTLSVIDTVNHTVVATIPVGSSPNAVAVNPTGTTVYVATGSGTISFVDTATHTVTQMTGFGILTGIAINSAGTRLYVTDADAPHPNGFGSVFSIDLTGARGPVRIPVGNGPMGVAVNSTGTRVYAVGTDAMSQMGAVWVIDAQTDTLEATVGVGDRPVGVAVNPTGSLVYVASEGDFSVSVIYARLNSVVEVVYLSNAPHGVGVDRTGAHVFIGNADARTLAGRVTIMNAASNSIIGNVDVGMLPASIGAFVSNGPTPAGPSGDEVAALQALLKTANETIETLMGQLETLKTANADLQNLLSTAQGTIARMVDEYRHGNETLASFIRRLMTGRTDANVAAAARAAAQEQLTLARERIGTRDWRIKLAQKEMDKGIAAMAAGHYQRAVKEFAQAYELCWRVRRA